MCRRKGYRQAVRAYPSASSWGRSAFPHEPELAAVAARGSKAGFDYRAVVANCAN